MKKRILLAGIITCFTLIAAGCSSSKNEPATKDVDLSEVYTKITENSNLSEDMSEISESELTSLYGIDMDEVKQYAGSITMVSTSSDEIIMLEATDSNAAADLKEKVDNRYEAKLNEMRDYLPDEYEKINACSVYSEGNYVAMFISDDSAAMTEIFKEAIGK